MKYIPCAQQSISNHDLEAVRHALTQPLITRGPLVETFENAISDYCKASYTVAFPSESAAFMAAYYAADLAPADRILMTPNAFISSIGSGVQRNAIPVFIDIDPSTGNFDIEQLLFNMNEPSLRGKTVIAPAHFAGIPVDVETIAKNVKNYRTVIIEDATQALGSRYKDGQKVGCCAWSDMTVFSFHPSQIITTGEGGAVTTNNFELYKKLQLYRNNGIDDNPLNLHRDSSPLHYEVISLSGNYNFTEFQAALGLSQLKRIDTFINQREKLLQAYKERLNDVPYLEFLTPPEDLCIAPHLCVVKIDYDKYNTTKSAIMNALKDCDISTRVHYIPLYRHPVFANPMGDLSEYFPKMEAYYKETLSLPFFVDLSEEEIDHVTGTLRNALQTSN